MHGVRTACIPVDAFRSIITGFCIPGDRDRVPGPPAPADDPGRFSENCIRPCRVDHLCLLFGSTVLPLRHIIAELIEMEDGEGIAVERSDHAKLELSVSVEVDEDRIAGRDIAHAGNLPLCSPDCRRIKNECALLAGHKSRCVAAAPDRAVSVIPEHAAPDQGQRELIILVIRGKVFRKLRTEAGTRETPVSRILMAGLETAYDKIIPAGSVQDAEAVDERRVTESAYFPVPFFFRSDNYDPGIQGVIRRVESVYGEELAVCSGNLSHGHDTAGLCPDCVQIFAILREEVAGILLFRRDKEAFSVVICKRCDRVALFKIGNDFF